MSHDAPDRIVDYLADQAAARAFATGDEYPPATTTRRDRVSVAVYEILQYSAASWVELAAALELPVDDQDLVAVLLDGINNANIAGAWDLNYLDPNDPLSSATGPGIEDRPAGDPDRQYEDPRATTVPGTAEDLYPESWWAARHGTGVGDLVEVGEA